MKSAGESVGALLGIAAALVVSALLLFQIRNVLPVGVIKLGVSMLQVFIPSLTHPPCPQSTPQSTPRVLRSLTGPCILSTTCPVAPNPPPPPW